ncbi:MAG TPA: ATP-binding protein [Pyrinomonadaceae bacterium]
MRDRFILDPKENILFIDFAGLRIESRAQVEEIARLVEESVAAQGRRVYAVVNYEGTEIAPEIVEYYGERIKELQARHAISTVRYSSSGLTRSVLRYLGAAVDLESNAFTTREEAIRAIRESERRVPTRKPLPLWGMLNPRRSLLGKLSLGWLAGLLVMAVVYAAGAAALSDETARSRAFNVAAAVLALLAGGGATGAILYVSVIRPLRRMESLARSLVLGGAFEPIEPTGEDETGQLARVLNETAGQLRRDIERLSGLYHISLMMGTGTEVRRICELLTRKTARLLGAEMCVIMLRDEPKRRISAQPPAYGVSDEHARLLTSGLDEENIATKVFHTGEPYMNNEVASGPLTVNGAKAPVAPFLFQDFPGTGGRPGRPSAAEALGVRAVLAVPLRAGERPLGTLMVMNKGGGFVEEDKQLVTIFASQAAQLIVNAQLFERVRHSEERHRQIFESALDGLYRSTRDGRLVTVNPALASMLDYGAAHELEGASLLDLFADRGEADRLLAGLNERGQALDVECELRRRAGDPLPTRISVRAVTDESDGRVYHLGIVRDVTEQKRLSEQLVVSEQLAVVGEMVAGVAHEVRNPLCGITTTVSALARRLEDREEVRPFIEVIMTEAGHLNHLMEQLLEHSRPVRLDGDGADVSQLIREVVGEWTGQAEAKGVALAFECGVELPGLRLDKRKMHGVFVNLIDNALHHTAPGGSVQIVATSPGAGRGSSARHEVRVEVRDTGAGIAPDKLPKIFDPFFTTRTTGTGLGLAIVQKTIHDHGGTITARSEPGKGTAFLIALPLKFGR